MAFSPTPQRRTITFTVEGVFDRSAATRLRLSVEASESDEVVLDFSRVSSLPDASIHVLVGGLEPRAISARGLATHQERMFRYLGVPTEPRAVFEVEA